MLLDLASDHYRLMGGRGRGMRLVGGALWFIISLNNNMATYISHAIHEYGPGVIGIWDNTMLFEGRM